MQFFPARLEALLRADHPAARVQNAGVSGDTTRAALHRLPRLLSSLDHRPDLAIVELGANDLISRVAPAQTRANLDQILCELHRCAIPILLASFEPPPFLVQHMQAYAGLYDALGAKYGAVVHPFFPAGIVGDRAHVLRDRLHPNALAIDKVARAMLPVVEGILRGQRPIA